MTLRYLHRLRPRSLTHTRSVRRASGFVQTAFTEDVGTVLRDLAMEHNETSGSLRFSHVHESGVIRPLGRSIQLLDFRHQCQPAS